MLQNLVGNALKFTPRGGRVRVHAERAAGEVRLTISDNGPGIAPEVREHLFQKFATAGPGQGSGLGLAFCRLAVEAQGGRIWVDRDQETGATFTFTLPLAA